MATLPFNPAKLDVNGYAIYERLKAHRAAQGAPFSGPYLALMNNPELTEKIEALGYYLKFDGALPREIYQFTVLYVAVACGADFEWQDHVAHARAAGIPENVIEAVRARSAITVEPYATALPVIEAAFKWQDVPQVVQDAAIARFGTKAYVELVVVTGFYQMFAGINQGFAVR